MMYITSRPDSEKILTPSSLQLDMKDPMMAEPQDGRSSDHPVSAWRQHNEENGRTSIELGESKKSLFVILSH